MLTSGEVLVADFGEPVGREAGFPRPVVVVTAMADGLDYAGIALVAALTAGLARLMPLAGASGTVTVGLALGFAAVGVPLPVAVVAAILARLVVGWLPIVAGALADDIPRR